MFLNLVTHAMDSFVAPSLLILLTQLLQLQVSGVATQSPFPEIYDFVIVGGGTAGCAVATRLSQSGKFTVLLLEAGGVPHPDLDIPGIALTSPHYKECVRTYQSVPQENAALANNGIIPLASGKCLGGSSSINGMVWSRGSPFGFDNWARLTNDSSWSYGSLLEYFKKSETYAGQFPSDQHGFKGPITVSQPRYQPLLREWLQAGQHLGFSSGFDLNGPQRIGYVAMEFNKRFGRRVSSYEGYLKPALGRANLRVITEAEVSQIMFQGKRATGVTFRRRRGTGQVQVLARNEVILCAGAIESPALLLRSGIGPSEVLKSAQIPQFKELPVGANLQNHVAFNLLFAINKSAIFIPDRDLTPAALGVFNTFGDGPYSTSQGNFAQAYLKSRESSNPEWADFMLLFLQVVTDHLPPGPAASLADWEAPVVINVSVGRPRSRGTVTLNPDNPGCRSLVDFQYFSNPKDILVMIDGIKAGLDTFEKTPQFRKVGARFLPVPLAPCDKLRFRSDEYWSCHVRQESSTSRHPSGTCRMGHGAEDQDAVVDSQLRVLGVKGLRVIDASIMPVTANANTQAAVYAIAEKGADMILDSWA